MESKDFIMKCVYFQSILCLSWKVFFLILVNITLLSFNNWIVQLFLIPLYYRACHQTNLFIWFSILYWNIFVHVERFCSLCLIAYLIFCVDIVCPHFFYMPLYNNHENFNASQPIVVFFMYKFMSNVYQMHKKLNLQSIWTAYSAPHYKIMLK